LSGAQDVVMARKATGERWGALAPRTGQESDGFKSSDHTALRQQQLVSQNSIWATLSLSLLEPDSGDEVDARSDDDDAALLTAAASTRLSSTTPRAWPRTCTTQRFTVHTAADNCVPFGSVTHAHDIDLSMRRRLLTSGSVQAKEKKGTTGGWPNAISRNFIGRRKPVNAREGKRSTPEDHRKEWNVPGMSRASSISPELNSCSPGNRSACRCDSNRCQCRTAAAELSNQSWSPSRSWHMYDMSTNGCKGLPRSSNTLSFLVVPQLAFPKLT